MQEFCGTDSLTVMVSRVTKNLTGTPLLIVMTTGIEEFGANPFLTIVEAGRLNYLKGRPHRTSGRWGAQLGMRSFWVYREYKGLGTRFLGLPRMLVRRGFWIFRE